MTPKHKLKDKFYKNTNRPRKPEETDVNIPVEDKLAVIEVYKFKCGLYTYWQKIVCKLPVLDECYVKYFKYKCKS